MPWLILSLTSRYLLVSNIRECGFWEQNMRVGSKLKWVTLNRFLVCVLQSSVPKKIATGTFTHNS